MKITTLGIDLAKDVFQLHGVDEHGKVTLRKQLKRKEMIEFFTKLEPCLIGMEGCGSAHHWARRLIALGHTVKLMAPQFVKPYVKSNKNDAADAEAICEAVTRPNMRFIPVKTMEQQAVLSLHRVRQGFVRDRTAHANQIRGLLAEFGLIVPKGIKYLHTLVPALLATEVDQLPAGFCQMILSLLEHMKALTRRIDEYEQQIRLLHRSNPVSRRLEDVPGIGPLTASALAASVGDARNFKNGRQLAAWLGLVPKQHSTGGKAKLQGISKRGDCYLRTLLIHGARAVIRHANMHPERYGWLTRLLGRCHKNVAAVALANKNARIAWALLAHEQKFRSDYSTV